MNTFVVENRRFYSELLCDISSQISGCAGKAVLSENGKIIDFSKRAELLSGFFPFEINRKSLLTKITSALEKNAQDAAHCEKTYTLLSEIENYLFDLSVDFPCDLMYNKMTASSLIRSAGVSIVDDSDSLAEKILNYMELVREFEGNKLFITVNLRSYVDDETMNAFLESVLSHKLDLLMLESNSYPRLKNEIRFTVDEDLCGF